MEKIFKLKENGTNVKTEIIAGITTFLAMAYILAVNPSILSAAGMDPNAIFAATAVSAAFATLIMAFYANYPVVLASGMGLNAYFAYTVVPQLAEQGITNPWQVALTAILVEGIIFIILSIFKFRETLVNKVPQNLKYGISAGIGLFITIVGLKGAGVITTDAYYDGEAVQSSTRVKLGDVGSVSSLLLHSGTTELKAQSLSVSLQHGFSVSLLSFAVGIRVHRSFLILQTTLYSDLSRIWQQKLSSSLISVMWHSMRLTLPLSYLHSSLLTSSIQ